MERRLKRGVLTRNTLNVRKKGKTQKIKVNERKIIGDWRASTIAQRHLDLNVFAFDPLNSRQNVTNRNFASAQEFGCGHRTFAIGLDSRDADGS